MNDEEYKTYNPHCSEWGKCERRLENDCRGCANNRKGTMIIFNKVFNENFKRLINNLDKLTNNDWLTIKEYNIMLINDFVNGYLDYVNNKCIFSMPIENRECNYDGDCVQHYLEYYIKNNFS